MTMQNMPFIILGNDIPNVNETFNNITSEIQKVELNGNDKNQWNNNF